MHCAAKTLLKLREANILKQWQIKRLFLKRCISHGKVRLDDLLNEWTNKFLAEGITDAASSAEYISAHVLGKKTLHDVNEKDVYLDSDEVASIHNLCRLRFKRMPVQYLLGEWDFDGLTLKMAPPVFIPRPVTEELVGHCNAVLESNWSVCKQYPVFLEIGCGSGAISVSLLKRFQELKAVCVDISSKACSLTETNAKNIGVKDRIQIFHGNFTHHEVLSKLHSLSPFCLLVSNPPYVTSEQMKHLSPEIERFEDLVALDGGCDGFDLVKHILHQAAFLVMSSGHLLMEVGDHHPEMINNYALENKQLSLQFINGKRDMFGSNRFCHLQVLSRLPLPSLQK